MITADELLALGGAVGEVRSHLGERIGPVRSVYADDVTGQPSWVTVRGGLFGLVDHVVPLHGGWVEGKDLVVPYPKELVDAAPELEVVGKLTAAQEAELFAHYGLVRDDTVREESGVRRLPDSSGYRADESADPGQERRDR